MANTHGIPDSRVEEMARDSDLLAPVILGSTLAVPSPPGLTFDSFSAAGYVRAGVPGQLHYVTQGTVPVSLAGTDGLYWLAIHHDTSTTVAGWSRVAGSHYLLRASATPPAEPVGGLILASVTVAGGVITAIDTSVNRPSGKIAYGSASGGLAFDTNLTWDGGTLWAFGSMEARRHVVENYAGNDATSFITDLAAEGGTNRWAILTLGNAPSHLGGALHVVGRLTGANGATLTGDIQTNELGVTGDATIGGTLDVSGAVSANGGATVTGTITTNELGVTGDATIGGTLDVSGAISGNGGATITGLVTTNDLATNSVSTNSLGVVGAPGNMNVVGNVEMGGRVGIGGAPSAGAVLYVQYPKNTDHGLMLRPTIDDNGAASPILFLNNAGAVVGSIQTNATSTAYFTTSDARLKEQVEPLVNGLGLIRALQPVRFRWRADGSEGVGFLAQHVAHVVPDIVHGAPDAVDEAGDIIPQQIDYSRLVPYLVNAVQTQAAQINSLIAERATQRKETAMPGTILLHEGGNIVGSLRTEERGSAYTTIFDTRLFHAEQPLDDVVDIIKALQPIKFLWSFDDSEGAGFRPHEVAEAIPIKGIVFGVRDDVDTDGRFRPQQMDMSKLVPHLVSIAQTLLTKVESLEARVAQLEEGLGV